MGFIDFFTLKNTFSFFSILGGTLSFLMRSFDFSIIYIFSSTVQSLSSPGSSSFNLFIISRTSILVIVEPSLSSEGIVWISLALVLEGIKVGSPRSGETVISGLSDNGNGSSSSRMIGLFLLVSFNFDFYSVSVGKLESCLSWD